MTTNPRNNCADRCSGSWNSLGGGRRGRLGGGAGGRGSRLGKGGPKDRGSDKKHVDWSKT